VTSLVADAGADAPADTGGGFLLLFSRTTGFRHDSIPTAIAALTELGAANGYVAEATEDPARSPPKTSRAFRSSCSDDDRRSGRRRGRAAFES
jgi:hypothetical protein